MLMLSGPVELLFLLFLIAVCTCSIVMFICVGCSLCTFLVSPSLFNYYIADMPRPTPPVKRVCYADDITVWATEPKIPQLESMITNYLRDVSIYLKDNSLLISAPKSTVTLFTQDKHQFQMHPDITLEDTQLPLKRSPKILGVILDPSISFHKHCNYVSDRIDKRNNMHWRHYHGDRIRRLY